MMSDMNECSSDSVLVKVEEYFKLVKKIVDDTKMNGCSACIVLYID